MLTDNDYRFVQIITKSVLEIDPEAQVNISSIVYSNKVEIKVKVEVKQLVLDKIKSLYKAFQIPLKMARFIKGSKQVFLLTFSYH
jgi:hypothetical protein